MTASRFPERSTPIVVDRIGTVGVTWVLVRSRVQTPLRSGMVPVLEVPVATKDASAVT